MMKRREFITLLGGVAAGCPFIALAQQPAMPVVGFVNPASPGRSYPPLPAFLKGLGETGFVEGRNVAIEYRWAEGHYERLPALIADLVQHKVLVIAATGTNAAVAAKMATTTIPIVFELGSDPVELGLVASLSQPGGNLTGVTNFTVELGSKQLGLLRDLVPSTIGIAALMNPNFAGTEKQLRDVEAAARVLGLQLIILSAGTEREIETAFATIAQQGVHALLVGIDPFFAVHCDQIVALAARYVIPAVYPLHDFAVAGGLMSYGTDFADAYHQAGIYTGRILRGEKPADLPVQRSTKFEFVINFKTAKTLGIEVPNSMQLLATEVIE
jgi:putative tryptophan/tyrosine transport system substrate-binding protein